MTDAKRKSKTAAQMESEMEDRQNIRREKERDQAEDLNQSIQTGTHDSERTGVNWPPSYRTLKKRKSSSKPSVRGRKERSSPQTRPLPV